MKKLRVRAPAKINLYLRVLGRRQDGYHELETVFQAVDLSDELFIEETSGPSTLQVPGHPHLETNGNLVLRSLRWMEERAQRPISVRMKLLKRIPEAAGLGGGSSDAAAALLGITALLDLGLQDHDLLQAAVGLGADVPFFLRGGTAVGEGIGERLTSVELPTTDYGVILVNPGFPVVTAAVFREYSKFLTGKMSQGTVWKVLRELQGVEDLLHNDLQAVAERLHPEITEVRRQMASAGVTKPLMSGSGPTVFGIGDPDRLVAIEERFPSKWSTYVTKPLATGVSID